MLRITGLVGLLTLIVVMIVGLPAWGQSGEAGTDVSAAEGEKFGDVIQSVVEKVKKLGPSKYYLREKI